MISLSPKVEFRKMPARADAHQEIMASPAFQDAARMALLQYQIGLALEGAPAASALKLKGAQEFLDVLMNLGNESKPISKIQEQALKPV